MTLQQLAPERISLLTGRFCTARVSLAADCLGSPNAHPVVFLPGGGQTRHSWHRCARAVAAAGLWSVCLDLRGHGDSDRAPDADYSFDAHARDIACLLAALPAPAVLVGSSLGGLAALLCAGEQLADVAGLVLVDIVPAPAHGAGRRRAMEFMRSAIDGFADLDEAAQAINAFSPRPANRPRGREDLEQSLRRREDGRWVWHWDPEIVAIDRTPTTADIERLHDAAATLSVPTLLLHAERSDVVDDNGVETLRRHAPDLEYEVTRGAGHTVTAANNHLFTAPIVAFLIRHGVLDSR
jgi:non-heme chloroperoxidase